MLGPGWVPLPGFLSEGGGVGRADIPESSGRGALEALLSQVPMALKLWSGPPTNKTLQTLYLEKLPR